MVQTAEKSSMKTTIRLLAAGDLDAVTAIDRPDFGASRKGFFEKRLAAVQKTPENYVTLGAECDGRLAGFVIGRISRGEFGSLRPAAAVDAIGVDQAYRGQGIGSALVGALEAALRDAGVEVVFSQADWTNSNLLRFFEAAGFGLAPRTLLEGDVPEGALSMNSGLEPSDDDFDEFDELEMPGEGSEELDFSDSVGDDSQALARDIVPIRSMQPGDLAAIAAIDVMATGQDRTAYFERAVHDALAESGIRVSLIATLDDRVVGYVIARVDYGEFGRTTPVAVVDSLGVLPDVRHRHVGTALMSQLFMNLQALRIERVRTVVAWDAFELLLFFANQGFRPSQRLALWKRIEPAD